MWLKSSHEGAGLLADLMTACFYWDKMGMIVMVMVGKRMEGKRKITEMNSTKEITQHAEG